jgi:mono/diheme cytochrome c family protein
MMCGLPIAAWLVALVTIAGAHGLPQGGWVLPATAKTDKNPLPVNAGTIAAGKKLFVSTCQRCHGMTAKGDGPDGDENTIADRDLTVASGAARNPDGVVFYKIWNGRESPKMPAQKDELSKEQVWAIVAYVQTLRAK